MTNKIIDPFTNKEFEFIDPFAIEEDKGGMGAAFGAGVDKVQELGYRAVKGFAESGENPDDYEEGSISQSVAKVIGQGGALSQLADEGIERNIEEQKEYEPTVGSYKDIDSIGDAAVYTGELVAGSLPYMAGAMTGVGAATMAGGLSEEAYDTQPEDDKNIPKAITSGVGQMALERLGIKGSLGQIGKDIMKNGVMATAKRYGKGEFVEAIKDPKGAIEFSKRVLKGSLWEGTTEMGQEALAQWGAGKDVSEIHGLDEAFVGGFVVGGVIRTSSEGAQRVFNWQEKAAPIAKNGIDELVKQGVPQEEAIEQMSKQLIESAMKQGLSEAEAAAAAARTMKTEYDIDHEVFHPIANELSQAETLQTIQQNDPAFFEQLNKQDKAAVDYEVPTIARNSGQNTDLEAGKFGDMLTSPVQDALKNQSEFKNPTVDERIAAAPLDKSPTPMDRFLPKSFEHKGDVLPFNDKQDLPGVTDESFIDGEIEAKPKSLDKPVIDPFKIEDKNIIFAKDELATQKIHVKGNSKPFKNERLLKLSKGYKTAIAQDKQVEIIDHDKGVAWRFKDNSVAPDIPINKVEKAQEPTASQEAVVVSEAKTIDEAAHEAATSPNNDLAEPTVAQAEANNYRLGRIEHSGFKIGIENPEGSYRKGIDGDGKEWSNKINHHYGDLTGTKGADGDAIDVFVKPSTTDGEKVFVVDQVNPSDGKFDEHKVMMGFGSKEEAEAAYRSNYDKNWNGVGNITEVSKDDFKGWVKNGDTTQPFAANKTVDENEIGEISKDLSSKIKRQAGKIKLENGDSKFGRVHIDERHGEEIKGIGYTVDSFVQEVANNYNSIYKANNGELLLAKRNGKDYLMFVRLKPSKDGDFYSVSTAYKADKRTINNRLKKEKVSLLWESTAPPSKSTTETSVFAHRSDDNDGSDEPNVTRHSSGSIAPKPKVDKIDDFGEVLHGANKHNYTFNEKLNDDVDLKAVPLSKSFPQPDYEKLAGEGADPRALAFMAQLRGEIKPKPRQAGKVERWSHQVSEARHNAKKLLEMGEGGSDIMIASLQKSERGRGSYLKYLPLILDIAKEIPAKNIKELGKFKLTHSFYNLYHGEKDVHKWVVTNTNEKGGFGRMGNMTHFDTSEAAVAFIKSQVTDESIVNGKKLAKFDIWHERGNRDVVFLGKKVGTGKFIELKQFPTAKEARQYINENNEELVALLKDKKKIKAHRRKDNNPRIGDDHRKGVNADSDMFDKAFGFRGVQFGNWVEGHKRQDDLNYAYDGLMDLAGVLNIPPKALSLNGELGLAFGARGKGGDNAAMAHYEPASVVINLTKKMGAGSLAHEWWHALDNYFSKMDSSKLGNVNKSFITEGGRQLGVRKDGVHQRAVPEDFGVRQEVYEAFTALTKAIKTETKLAERSAELDKLRSKDYWGTVIEMTARSFERYVIDKLALQGFESDYLANIVKESSTEASKEISDYPYPLAVEMDAVNKAYDSIFDILQTKETDQGVALFSADTSIKAPFNKISLKEAQNIVNEFQQEYNGNVPLKFRVVEKQEHLYGPENTIEKIGLIKGSYHPKSGILGITSSNMQNRADGQATLRHEILGHYGLNTFKADDKRAILQRIIKSKKHTSLKDAWAHVDENYPKVDAIGKAEEVFAMIAEKPPTNTSFWGGLVVLVRKALRAIGIGKGSISKAEIESYIQDIAKSIKSGEAKQQTFPKSDQEQFRRESPSTNATQINIQDESRKDTVIRVMQDKFRRLKLIQRELSVNDSNDTYQAEEAFHGKVGEDLRALENKHTDKIADTMAEHNLSQDEVDLYLIAKHASERNAYIDTINPELNGAGSGMANEAAQAILDKSLIENKRLALEKVANHVYAMLKQNREMMAEFGLEAQDAIDTWQQQYEFYVPLKGYAAEDGATDSKGKKFGTGKGFNIKGRETIKAMGRRSLAESPLLHTISDTTQAIIRARKNEVGNTFLKLVKDNPDPELWEVFTAENPDTKRGEITKDGETTIGKVSMTAFEMKASEEYFKTKVDGTEQFIKIKDPLLARAMGNLGVDESNMLTQNLGKVTRLLSALVTTWNPEFMLTNFTRDVQAAVANVLAETQVKDGKAINTNGLAKKMIKSLPKAMAVLKHGFRDNNFDDAEWGSYLKEFLESGAKTGWVNQKDIEGLASELKGSISRASNTNTGKVKRAGKAVADFVSDYNDIVENASRFSAYYHARKQGVTVKKASSLSKNLTINFNRKGEVGNTLNALFMFANASVQGTANMMRALATPKDRSKSMWNPQFYNLSQKLAISSIGATVLMANAMRELGGDDEDGESFYDKVPDHVKATNFVIMTGGKGYVAIPMPYGYNFLAGVGHALDGLMNGKSAARQATKIALSTVSTFSPLGLSDSDEAASSLLKMIVPTIGKPIAEMAIDENFFGGHIYPDDRGYSVKKADANRGLNHTWEFSKNFTSWLNEATGGSEFRSGYMDFSPQSIDHLAKFMGGGVLQFGLRWQNLAVKAVYDKDIEVKDVPFARRFYKQLNPQQSFSEFYDAKKELAKYKADLEHLRGSDKVEFRNKYKNQLLLQKFSLGIDKSLRALNKQKGNIEGSRLSDSAKEDKLQRINDKKLDEIMRFSKKQNNLKLNNI